MANSNNISLDGITFVGPNKLILGLKPVQAISNDPQDQLDLDLTSGNGRKRSFGALNEDGDISDVTTDLEGCDIADDNTDADADDNSDDTPSRKRRAPRTKPVVEPTLASSRTRPERTPIDYAKLAARSSRPRNFINGKPKRRLIKQSTETPGSPASSSTPARSRTSTQSAGSSSPHPIQPQSSPSTPAQDDNDALFVEDIGNNGSPIPNDDAQQAEAGNATDRTPLRRRPESAFPTPSTKDSATWRTTPINNLGRRLSAYTSDPRSDIWTRSHVQSRTQAEVPTETELVDSKIIGSELRQCSTENAYLVGVTVHRRRLSNVEAHGAADGQVRWRTLRTGEKALDEGDLE